MEVAGWTCNEVRGASWLPYLPVSCGRTAWSRWLSLSANHGQRGRQLPARSPEWPAAPEAAVPPYQEQPRGSQCSCTLCSASALAWSAASRCCQATTAAAPAATIPAATSAPVRLATFRCSLAKRGHCVTSASCAISARSSWALGSGLRAEGFLRPNGEVYIAVKRARRSSSLIDGERVACCGYTTSAAKQHKGRGFKVVHGRHSILDTPQLRSALRKNRRPLHVDLFVQKKLSHSTGGWDCRLGRADRRGVSRHYCCGPRTCCRGWTACPRHCRRRPLAFQQAPQPSLVGLRANRHQILYDTICKLNLGSPTSRRQVLYAPRREEREKLASR